METRGRRPARVVRPVAQPPEVASAEEPDQVLPSELAETTLTAIPEQPEVVVERVPAVIPAIASPPREPQNPSDDAFAAIEEARTAMARGFHAWGDEVVGLARCSIDASARTAIEMLSAKTFSDVITVNTGFARANFDNWLDGSARFSELGVRLAVETARPFLARLSKTWSLTARPAP